MSNWREKLRGMMERAPNNREAHEASHKRLEERREEITEFIQNTVIPAFEQIRTELENFDREVEIVPGKYKGRMVVRKDGVEEFSYVIRGNAYHRMSFAWPVLRNDDDNQVTRAEIQRPGGLRQAFNLNEFTQEGIIEDFLDSYRNWIQ